MAIRSANVRLGALFYVLSAATTAQASQPSTTSWVALSKGNPAPASVTRKSATANSLNIVFSIPGLEATDVSNTNGIHGRLSVPDSGHTSEIGKPELPVIRRLIVAPEGASLSLSWKATPTHRSLTELGLRGPLIPTQKPIPKIPHAREKAIFEKDTAAYSSDTWLPAAPVTIKEAGNLSGRRLAMIEVSPVAYNPSKGTTLLYSEIDVTITFDGQKGASSLSPLLPSEASTLQSLTLNGDTLTATATSGIQRLLIISPLSFTNTLKNFVTHKQNLGWVVNIATTNSIGSTTSRIQSYITNAYWSVSNRPTALLLVGDTQQIPCFTGVETDVKGVHPDTDLYYTCMGGGSDWQPEFPVGRFSATSTTILSNIIAKSIASETNPPAAWNKHAAFIAGFDQNHYAILEQTHNNVITNILNKMGFTSAKLYRHSCFANADDFSAAFNSGQSLAVYSGHGSSDGWHYVSPFSYVKYGELDINSLTNKQCHPFIASFACLVGQFGSVDSCLAETWLQATSKGASSVFAASTDSNWDEDDFLQRKLFEAIFTNSSPSIGDSILASKQQFLLHYDVSSITRLYYETYNLLGDPTSFVLRRTPAISPDIAPTAYLNEPYTLQLYTDTTNHPCTWSILSGTLPSGLSLNTNSGLINGTASTTGTCALTISVTDEALLSTSRQYQISVAEHLRPPANTTLPLAVSNQSYSFSPISQGGIPSMSWINATMTYSMSNIPSCWQGGGTAKNWKADEGVWRLNLPWAFTYFGETHTSVWVFSNGYLDFTDNTSYLNDTVYLPSMRIIAPLWDDLDTTSGNIYVTTNADYIAIRWDSITYDFDTEVNVEVMLHRSGKIIFNYGSPSNTGLTPTIGISSGSGQNYYLSSHNDAYSIPTNVSEAFIPDALPEGLILTSSGSITGCPSQLGTFSLPCRLHDAATHNSEYTNFTLSLTVLNSTTLTPAGTPTWWMIVHGLTNYTFDTEDTTDSDTDGMDAWAEYVAGTDPTNNASSLRFTNLSRTNGNPHLKWLSADSLIQPPPPYIIWAATNLMSTNWLSVTNIQDRTPPTNTLEIPPPFPSSPTFFRITIPH